MDCQDPRFVDLDLVETLDAVVAERLQPVPDPFAPPLAPAMSRWVRQLTVVDLHVLSHERPVEVTGPISRVEYPGEQLGGRHRTSILAGAR
jgi:hypothetical protein